MPALRCLEPDATSERARTFAWWNTRRVDSAGEAAVRGLNDDALAALDALMRCWARWDLHEAYYLDTLAPEIVLDGAPANARENEVEAIAQVRRQLGQEHWQELPAILRARRLQVARERRERAEAHEREEEERQLAEERRAQAERELPGLVDEHLQCDFLGVDEWFNANPLAAYLPAGWLDERKVAFVQVWARKTHDTKLDAEQARAVCAAGNVRVTARAGSGKTRTLVTRAAFLVQHCAVPAEAVLLVAFNRSAAEEVRRRLRDMLPAGQQLPFAMTFHALAHALVHPDEELLSDTEQRPVLSGLVQSLINRMLSTPDGAERVRAAMLEYFTAAWEALDERGLTEGREAFFRRELESPMETLAGDFVKSYGEKLIANVLFRHDVDYRYERGFRWDEGLYRPDFTLLAGGKPVAVLEYFGRVGDQDYDAQSAAKREFWARRSEVLLELTPTDIARGSEHCTRWLLQRLDEHGIAHRQLTDDEVWERAQRRAVDRFSTSVSGFIGRARQQDLGPDELSLRVASHSALDGAEAAFLALAESLYRDYIEELGRQHAEDFAGLMWRAVRQIAGGQTKFVRDRGRQSGDVRGLRYVLVDEFQDFSVMFDALLRQVVRASAAQVFAVGDDWQAINGFAGADLAYFDRFSDAHPQATLLALSTNYRSPMAVVQVGNAIMLDRGAPARADSTHPGAVLIADPASDTSTERTTNRFAGDASTPALLRLLRREIAAGARDIAVLVRRKSPPWRVQDADVRRPPDSLTSFEAYLRAQCSTDPDVTLHVSTAHAFKGREADSVIVADAHERAYPLLHPAWSFTRVFGDDEDKLLAEERRLFYVASTRARRTLIYLASGTASRFLSTEPVSALLTPLDLDSGPSLPASKTGQVEVRVINGYDAREQLKRLGFRWNASMRVWHKRMPPAEADPARLRTEAQLPTHAVVEVVELDVSESVASTAGERTG